MLHTLLLAATLAAVAAQACVTWAAAQQRRLLVGNNCGYAPNSLAVRNWRADACTVAVSACTNQRSKHHLYF